MRKQIIFILIMSLSMNLYAQNYLTNFSKDVHREPAKCQGFFASSVASEDPVLGPSFGLLVGKIRNKSLNVFVDSYNLENSNDLEKAMEKPGIVLGTKYGFSFSIDGQKDRMIICYIGQQKTHFSLEGKLKNGYTRKIDFSQKDVLDMVAYFPVLNYFYIGTKLAWTTQTIDAYKMFGKDKVYDDIGYITGVYRTGLGGFTTGIELKANIKVLKWLIISPSLAYQSTFGLGSQFRKGYDQWDSGSSSTYYFPSDYKGYLSSIANYTVLPDEGFLKARNRMLNASISVLINF